MWAGRGSLVEGFRGMRRKTELRPGDEEEETKLAEEVEEVRTRSEEVNKSGAAMRMGRSEEVKRRSPVLSTSKRPAQRLRCETGFRLTFLAAEW